MTKPISNDTETQAINSNNWCNLMKCIWHNIDQSGPYKHTESSNSNSLSKRWHKNSRQLNFLICSTASLSTS